jgi:outer membrane protein OmpA-like peptidoglycan-associated protein
MKYLILINSILFICNYIRAQELIQIKNSTDCASAYEISTLSGFGPTGPPKEVKLDVPNNPFNKSLYQVWYKFTTEKDGMLLFDILPIDPADNYDFLLYKVESANYCNDIKNGKLVEVRSNISRNDPELKGMTGLAVTVSSESYSPGIDVKKGEQYILVLNNMYKCKGHSIVFKYLEGFTVNGKITLSDKEQPVQVEVFWTNLRTKETTSHIETNKQGEFKLPVLVSTEVHRFPNYLLWAYADGYYIADTLISSKEIPSLEKTPFSFKLFKLKKGNNDFLPVILFEPNDERIIFESMLDLERMLRLMQKNSKLEIILEGHSNGFYPSTEIDIDLSVKRAENVKKWLVDNGISADRIKTKGLGSEKMLYPMAQDEKEEQMNRRVEINISKL